MEFILVTVFDISQWTRLLLLAHWIHSSIRFLPCSVTYSLKSNIENARLLKQQIFYLSWRCFIPGTCGWNSVTSDFSVRPIDTVNVKSVESAWTGGFCRKYAYIICNPCPKGFFQFTLALMETIFGTWWLLLKFIAWFLFWRLIFFFNQLPFYLNHMWKQLKTNMLNILYINSNKQSFIYLYFIF